MANCVLSRSNDNLYLHRIKITFTTGSWTNYELWCNIFSKSKTAISNVYNLAVFLNNNYGSNFIYTNVNGGGDSNSSDWPRTVYLAQGITPKVSSSSLTVTFRWIDLAKWYEGPDRYSVYSGSSTGTLTTSNSTLVDTVVQIV